MLQGRNGTDVVLDPLDHRNETYAIGDQWRNNSRKSEGMEPKQKQHPFVNGLVIEAGFNAVKSNIA